MAEPETFEVVTTALADIRPYPGNPRVNAGAIPKVAASLEEFGPRQPIVVDRHGVIVVGHTRYQAALSLGWREFPVHWARNLTPAQARAYRIADNRTNEESDWDWEKLSGELQALSVERGDLMPALGFDQKELDRYLGGGPEPSTLGSLTDEFGVAPFSVMNAREGWWQDRKAAWIGLGIQSELGRGEGSGDKLTMSETIQGLKPSADQALKRSQARAAPGGSPRPAASLKRGGGTARGDGHGREQ